MNIDKKLINLEKEIMLQAEDECQAIRDEYEASKDDMISKQELTMLTSIYNNIQKEKRQIEKAKNNRILAIATQNKQKLTIAREKMIDEIFNHIDIKVKAFVESEDYLEYLKKTLDNVSYAFPDESLHITLDKNDQKYQEVLKKYNDKIVAIELSFDDLVGGMIVKGIKSGKVYDNSLKSVISYERKNFLRNNKIG